MGRIERSASLIRDFSILLVPVVLISATGCHDAVRDEEPEVGAPNVLLISIDTLRMDHLGIYGYHRDTTPNLEVFAEDGVIFDMGVNTGGATLPVHMSMMTSLHPLVHRVTPFTGNVLAEPRTTLAEALRGLGFSTAAFTDGGWVKGKFGFYQGFETFDDKGGHFEAILPKARQWIESISGHPFFLFLHTYDVHSGEERLQYDSPEDFYNDLYRDSRDAAFDGCIEDLCASQLLRQINERILNEGLDPGEIFSEAVVGSFIDHYDGSINYVDDELASLFDFLRRLGIYDNTLIIVTSDHGEEFLEHGFFLHRQGVYDEVARVPLIIKFPGSEFAGSRFEGMVSTVDLMPTVLDYLGSPPPVESNGVSVLPQLRGTPNRREDAVIASALRTERWKLVVSGKELFDLETDPHEQVNVYDQHPDEVQNLMQIWRRRVSDLRAMSKQLIEQDSAAPSETIDLTAEEKDSLRALGYIQ